MERAGISVEPDRAATEPARVDDPPPRRESGRLSGIAFRFVFAYWLLYNLPSPLQFLPVTGGLADRVQGLIWGAIVPWVGRQVLHLTKPIDMTPTGSGDKTCDWVQALCVLGLALVATLVWSVLERKPRDPTRLRQWLRWYIRLVLGGWMIIYGASKLIPTQMSMPSLASLLRPYGEFSPMGVLWSFMGSSPAYTSFTGAIEIGAGLLLCVPRTALLGALIALGAATHIFVLNLCYDVPVKLFSFHLVLMALFLASGDGRRLLNFFLLNRRVEPGDQAAPLCKNRLLHGLILGLPVLFGLYLTGARLWDGYKVYQTYGDGAPKSPFYGYWAVDEFKVDGFVQAPLLSDGDQWRRVIFQGQTLIAVQHMDGEVAHYSLRLDIERKTIALDYFGTGTNAMQFTFKEPQPGRLHWDGRRGNSRLQVKMRKEDEQRLLLLSRGFHWIQESPFTR